MTSDHQSVRFHLSYPRQANVFTWAECACLARSLGYRDTSLQQCYRQAIDAKYAADGFQLSQLDAFLGSKFFKSGFDFTHNSHSCEWNEQVVRKAFAVTAGRGMTFQQLYTTRIAYGLYESSDLRGLKAKPRTVMRALKACGRAISLGKMAHRVRHMKFHEPGRLQLDEFIDLALWAGPLDCEEARCALRSPEDRHDIVSFEEMLTPIDTRIQHRLDAEYRQEERQYVREIVRPAETRLRHCPVQTYREKRLERTSKARISFEPLRRALRESASVLGSRSLATSSRAASAYWTDATDDEDEASGSGENIGYPSDIDTNMAFNAKTESANRKKRPATSCSVTRRSTTPTLVTQSDLSRTELLLDALAFQTEALPELHARRIADNMQTLRPGFQQRHAKRLSEASLAAEESRKVAEAQQRTDRAAAARQARQARCQLRQARFEELAIRTEPEQLPSHGRVCDAADQAVGLAVNQRQPVSRRQQPQPKSRPATATGLPVKKPVADDEPEEQWLEPQLGLALPLRSPACHVSRISYSCSCPPRQHPVGRSETLKTAPDDASVSATVDLIQRAIYAKA